MSVPILTTKHMAIPALGLGTWPMKGADCEEAVGAALDMGYRHLDTAEMYGNEEAVGAALAATSIPPRGEIFLTTKVWWDKPNGPAFRAAFEGCLTRLKQPYVNLLLIHWPSPELDLPSVLTAMAKIREEGLARAVGVANFPSALLKQALALDITPIACNQVEHHVMLSQQKLLDITQPAGIVLTSYTPLGKGAVLDHPVIQKIAREHGATPGQVALAWLLSKNLVAAIPKARGVERQAENLAAVQLKLSDSDLAEIAALPKSRRFINPGSPPPGTADRACGGPPCGTKLCPLDRTQKSGGGPLAPRNDPRHSAFARGALARAETRKGFDMAEPDDEGEEVDLGISLEIVATVVDLANAVQEAEEAEIGDDDDDEPLDEDEDEEISEEMLTDYIDELNEEQQVALIALAWVGRGDYEPRSGRRR